MKNIVIENQGDRLILGTSELDGYICLSLADGKADTSRLDDNTCQKTFACSTKELCEFIKKEGY